jgi:pentapeptide MXKDX repeat protein
VKYPGWRVHHRSFDRGDSMKALLAGIVSAALALGSSFAVGADDMKKDAMSKDAMKKDMAKDGMKKDAMGKDEMKKDAMKKDEMKK